MEIFLKILEDIKPDKKKKKGDILVIKDNKG